MFCANEIRLNHPTFKKGSYNVAPIKTIRRNEADCPLFPKDDAILQIFINPIGGKGICAQSHAP